MQRRNLAPLAILAVLVVLTAVFAVVGARAAPSVTTIDVQNATEKTFGTPVGSNSFLMDLRTSLSAGAGGTQSAERLVDYLPPNRIAVYVVGTTTKIAGVLHQPAVSCVLHSYAAMFGGSMAWNQKGQVYKRTESLGTYTARVPRTGVPGTCSPAQSTALGQVHETAILRSGYLVGAGVQIVVPSQNLSGGRPATYGVQGESMVFIEIAGKPVRRLAS